MLLFLSVHFFCYYLLINKLSNVEITPGGSDFRLMDKKRCRLSGLYRERARFIRGMVNTLGFKVAKDGVCCSAAFCR
jgi:dolichol-phosphate mannosyltransferase